MKSDRRIQNYVALAIYLYCATFWGCASTVSKITTTGQLAGQVVATTVDSEVAKYYLEHYLQDAKTHPEYDSLIDEIHDSLQGEMPNRKRLKWLSDKASVDCDALYLANYLLKSDTNEPIQGLFNREVSRIKYHLDPFRPPLFQDYSSYLILFIPGWFYKTDPWTGADLARQRKVVDRLGINNLLVNVDENGTIEDNAKRIAEYINRISESEKKIILVSVSKAGTEVALALSNLLEPQQTENIKAWINIGGLLQGSPIADSAARWPKRWIAKIYFFFKGWDFASVESMTTWKSRARFAGLKIPRHILTINYIGIPLSGSITVLARDRYMKMRTLGPNDGLTLITDALVPHSYTIAQLGLDHFFFDPEINIKSLALIHTLLQYLEADQKRK